MGSAGPVYGWNVPPGPRNAGFQPGSVPALQFMPTGDKMAGTDLPDSSNWEIVEPESQPRQPRQSGCCGCIGCLVVLVTLAIAFFAIGELGFAAIGAVLGTPEILVFLLAGVALWAVLRILARLVS